MTALRTHMSRGLGAKRSSDDVVVLGFRFWGDRVCEVPGRLKLRFSEESQSRAQSGRPGTHAAGIGATETSADQYLNCGCMHNDSFGP